MYLPGLGTSMSGSWKKLRRTSFELILQLSVHACCTNWHNKWVTIQNLSDQLYLDRNCLQLIKHNINNLKFLDVFQTTPLFSVWWGVILSFLQNLIDKRRTFSTAATAMCCCWLWLLQNESVILVRCRFTRHVRSFSWGSKNDFEPNQNQQIWVMT